MIATTTTTAFRELTTDFNFGGLILFFGDDQGFKMPRLQLNIRERFRLVSFLLP
jgi:hypothetical protein